MAGGGATISEKTVATNARLGDLRLGGVAFCVICEWELCLSEMTKTTRGLAVVYICPTCGETLAVEKANGKVVPKDSL